MPRAYINSLVIPEPVSSPVVLEVEADEKELRADTRPYLVPPKYVLVDWMRRLGLKRSITPARWQKLIASGVVPSPRDLHDWMTTLEAVHSVEYDGLLPANRIVKSWDIVDL